MLHKITILNLEIFMKKFNLKDINKVKSDLKKVYNYPIYPRDSIITTDRGFVNIDDGGNSLDMFLHKRQQIIPL